MDGDEMEAAALVGEGGRQRGREEGPPTVGCGRKLRRRRRLRRQFENANHHFPCAIPDFERRFRRLASHLFAVRPQLWGAKQVANPP